MCAKGLLHLGIYLLRRAKKRGEIKKISCHMMHMTPFNIYLPVVRRCFHFHKILLRNLNKLQLGTASQQYEKMVKYRIFPQKMKNI